MLAHFQPQTPTLVMEPKDLAELKKTEKLILYPHADPGQHQKFTSRSQSLPMSTTLVDICFRVHRLYCSQTDKQTDRQNEWSHYSVGYQQQTTWRKVWITSLGRCQVDWRSVHTAVESQLRVLSSRESSVETTPHATPAYHLHHNILIIIILITSSKQTHIPSHLTAGTHMPVDVSLNRGLNSSSSSSGGTPSGGHSRLHNWTPFGAILCAKRRRVEAKVGRFQVRLDGTERFKLVWQKQVSANVMFYIIMYSVHWQIWSSVVVGFVETLLLTDINPE